MKRFAALGLLFTSAVAGAGEPVSVYPPAAAPPAGSGLNQSLPAAVQSALPAAPPPVLTSTPSWVEPVGPTSTPIPTVGPSYLTQAAPPAAGCAPAAGGAAAPAGGPVCYGADQVRPHFNLLQRPNWLRGATADGGGGGSCREQLKAWLHFQPTPSGVPIWCPTPYKAPLRAYFPARPTDCAWNLGCAGGGGGCGTDACATDRGAPMRDRLAAFQRPQRNGAIPTTPLPPGECAPGGGRPRVVYVPVSPRAEGPCADAGTAGFGGRPSRPSLLGRMKAFVTGDGFGCGGCGGAGCVACSGAGVSFGGGYGCPPPPPSPVRYASPCASPPAPQPGVNYANPTATPPQPPFGGPAVGPAAPATTVKGPNTAAAPKPAAPSVPAAVAFTNP